MKIRPLHFVYILYFLKKKLTYIVRLQKYRGAGAANGGVCKIELRL